MIGKKLAHYEITGLLGKGGMGEVYRAHDTTLGRDVALKILPLEVSADPERAARFEREARTLASLQHTNIASIYGYEEVDGVRFLAMELIEGEDLAQRLEQGRIPTDEALRIAQQIAIGLEAAHEKNIVHRDLKPANVKVDREGTVKILDFGLARAYAGDGSDTQDLQTSPTITAAMTQAGMILGTAAYMSPEQARGKSIDKRSDIWSFGVMLYEMLTGTQMYRGETVTDILGAIVHSDPDLTALPSDAPPKLRKLLERCLTPDSSDRLRDIGEARYALQHLDQPEALVTPATAAKPNRAWAIACLLLLIVVAGMSLVLLRSPRPSQPVLQASIALPEGHQLLTTGPLGGSVRVAPDGRSIAFVAQQDGKRQIWVRSFDESEGHPVQGTEGGHRPFWSPDGRSLGFFVQGQLRRVSVSGGAPLTIASATDGRGAAWLSDGTIVFAPNPGSALYAVSAGGGQTRQVTDATQYTHREPRVLPDGRHFLYLENRGGGLWQVSVGSTEDDTLISVVATGGGAEYADGRLLFLQGRTLVAQPFDTGSFQLTGEPTPLAEGIVRDSNYGVGVFSASDDGVLVYQAGGAAGAQLQWMDRDGNELDVLGDPGAYSQVSLSPDARTAAVLIDELDGKSDLWLIDVERGNRQRFTFTPDESAMRRSDPIWSPDGKIVVFSLEYDGHTTMYKKRTDGSSQEELLLDVQGMDVWPYDISPNGQWVVYGQEDETSNEDLWVVSLSGDPEPRALFETPFDEWPGRFSPDGRWLAFDSDETGRREIYVIPFPERGGKWQVSREGGRYPRWSEDGRELYYVDLEGGITAVSINTSGESLSSGHPTKLFQANLNLGSFGAYDVDLENDRFLILQPTAQDAPISLYLNWKLALDAR